ncbi:hypothetical protein GGE50_001446 [Rhizobium leguminosarum]|uniref:hypothetical protein n=1 Tax=Rhizobium leguminosarum TaxID=384 RepID=UPI0016176BA7|nr:hypothetical protein [Rhizobium leguminosarum]MBB4585580.1 hypothetical protein [Rhizobium leguminosarum]
MSGSVLRFESDHIEFPSDRVREFVELAREIDVLIKQEDWDADLWQVGASFVTKGQNRDNRVLAFYNRDATLTNRQEIVGGAPLADGLKDFAKAYVRYMHSTSQVSFENTMKRLDAIQLIEAAFRSLGLSPSIENLNVAVLNTAVSLAKVGVGAGRAYQFALYIQQVHRFCLDRKFLIAPFQWKHGVKKPKDKTEAIGKEAKAWRDEKLPSPEAFHALAHIYRNSETFVDRLFSAITAIFVAFPIRVHEVLQLRGDCEVFEEVKNPETGEMVDAYGIRVFPGKGHPPQVKWVPTQMASIVQEAVGRIREMCSEARAVAAWYEERPGELWLPEDLEPCRAGDWLDIKDVMRLVGTRTVGQVPYWVRTQGVEWRSDGLPTEYMKGVRISSLATRLLRDMPRDFPKFNGSDEQKYSDTLILLFVNQAHAQRGTYPTLIEQMTVQTYDHWLSGHDGGKKQSVFEAWRFTERDGSPINISSHSFRHWLNTVAQLKGMSDMDIAKWSGRKLEQNAAYNHVSSEEILSQIREALDDGTGIGPMFEAAKATGVNRPVDRRDFAEAQIGAALTTELGICVHDYSLLPCQTHGDCLDCSENVFIKGDTKHRDRIGKRLVLTERQLQHALWAMGDDYFGADKWVLSHQRTIEKLRRILAIHDDPTIPDGTIVNLAGSSKDNEVAMALRDRGDGGASALQGIESVALDAEDAEANALLADMWED